MAATRASTARSPTTAAAAGTLGHRPQLEPENAFSLWNRFDLGGGWGAGLGLVHQGAAFTNVDNVVRLPAFDRVDRALYTFVGGKTRLALNVENLGDKKYYATAEDATTTSAGGAAQRPPDLDDGVLNAVRTAGAPGSLS